MKTLAAKSRSNERPLEFRRSCLIVLLAALPWLSGCSPKAAAPAAGAGAPTEVGVVTVKTESIPLMAKLPGRVTAIRVAQVRARVPGILLRQVFKEGADVKTGDVLFEIDQAPLQAALDSMKASLAKAEANQQQTRTRNERYKALVAVNAISKQDYDDAVGAALQAEADVLSAKAALETASLNLGYAKVTSPIDGRIGRALVTEGALVGMNEATPLALIQQLDPIYVDFTESSTELLRLRRALDGGQLKSAGAAGVEVSLELEDGFIYAPKGQLKFSDISVDPSTAMVSIRAEFPNADKFLLPGMFARGSLEQARNDAALTVPQRGVARGANGSATVMTVNAENKVEVKVVQTEMAVGDKWIVSKGLKDGDRVIVEGLQRARPGSVVSPVPFVVPGAEPAK
ncbi:MAG TPA: efflux RND transporter periplasmic adaptor subunit [Candidatus Limnocylindria bacterium]|nr:efflux RND transporter periplasmic adaptor subunit [Candidatus Limnocylindria bacterium]